MSAPFVLDRPDLVHRAVCAALTIVFGVSGGALTSDGRFRAVAWPRQVGMFVMAVRLDANHTQTARYFGRDRSTVSYTVARVGEMSPPGSAALAQIDAVERATRVILDLFAAEETERDALSGWRRAHG